MVAVGPGVPLVPGPTLFAVRAGFLGVNPLPLQGAKIHRPPLRDDVLSRERLNGWLDQATTGRLALIVAEAGFGKTTLLADWSRHTQRLTAWYRLEPDDRDWLTFIRHLVGSGRELEPGFAPETFARLLQLGPGGPTQASLVTSLVGELAAFGASQPNGLTLILDDYHVIDGSDETDPIVRAILERTGPGFSVIIATRSIPRLPLGRLRARGAVTRLDGEALCFDTTEADLLFRTAYHQPLEPDVLADLIDRTEGWPALLSLVHASLEERGLGEAAILVRGLSGAGGDMYDFLAEEVVDRLPPDLAAFLTRASILDELEGEAASIVSGSNDREVAAFTAAADELGLLVRPDADASPRFLPLVRDFLAARLESAFGAPEVREMHLALGRHFRGRRWRTSATHLERAGEVNEAAAVIEESLDEILGRGEYRAAMDVLADGASESSVQSVLRSRLLLQVGAVHEAVAVARGAVESAEDHSPSHVPLALLNAASIATAAGLHDDAVLFAGKAASVATDATSRELAEGYEALFAAAGSASLPRLALQLERMLANQLRREQWHYAGITSLNLAQVLTWLERAPEALRVAAEAERLLGRSSRGYEAVSVSLVQARAKALLGHWTEAEGLLAAALDTRHPEGHLEAILEAASLAAWYGPPELAREFLAYSRRGALPPDWALHSSVVDLWLEEDQERRQALLARLPDAPPHSTEVGAAFRWYLSIARAHRAGGRTEDFAIAMSLADEIAASQRSPLQIRLATLLRAIDSGAERLSQLLQRWPARGDATLAVFAPEVCSMLDRLTSTAVATLLRAGKAQPQRWLAPLRSLVAGPSNANSTVAASLLEQMGESEDIVLLREFSRKAKRTGRVWGDELLQRVAPRVMVEDLGLMSIAVGERAIDGRGIRRKVLALLAFLATQPSGSATPDQVLDALWPDLDPDQGSNSIHQTIYFLRRVLDPTYRAGLSPEYVHFDAEVIWLDTSLVDCRSWLCRRLLQQRPEDGHMVEAVIGNYRGTFASDFAYEDWAASYRESLHARYLSVVERAVGGSLGPLDIRWRLWVGQQALGIDPEADAIEAHVIRLYRAVGAPTAAAEQYAHYAALMRDQLGIDAPDLEDL